MFILWGNGINYVSSIVNMIRGDKNSEWQKNIDMMKEKFKISMGL